VNREAEYNTLQHPTKPFGFTTASLQFEMRMNQRPRCLQLDLSSIILFHSHSDAVIAVFRRLKNLKKLAIHTRSTWWKPGIDRHISFSESSVPHRHWKACSHIEMTDSDFFISDSALKAPLCAFYPISSFDEPSQDDVPNDSNSGDAKDTSSSRFYSTVELMELVEVLQVPFLYQNRNHRHLSTPAVMVGRGGFSTIRQQNVANWLEFKHETMDVAIKEFTLRVPSEHTAVATGTVSITQTYIEICVMKHPHLLGHPNITQLLGITDETIPRLM
jgi:hypothetical protein